MKLTKLVLIGTLVLLINVTADAYAYRGNRQAKNKCYGSAIRAEVRNVDGGVQMSYTSDNPAVAQELQARAARDAERYNSGAYCPIDAQGHMKNDFPGYSGDQHAGYEQDHMHD